MRRLTLLAVALCIAFFTTAATALAATESAGKLSSKQLVESPKEYDGKTVTFAGEVIGEQMRRGDFAWIHVNDDAYMLKHVEEGAELLGYNSGMPVWIGVDFTDKLSFFGDYRHQGDVVQLTGTFNAACAQHGGDMDIHAEDLVVVADGRVVKDPIQVWKIWLALALTGSAAAFWWADRRQRARELKGWLVGSKARR